MVQASRLAVVPCVALLAMPLLQALTAQEAHLAGRATSSVDGRGLADVELLVDGPRVLRLRADAQGAWRAQALPAGTYTLRARLMGYIAQTRELSLRAGDTLRLDIALAPAALALDQVVVSAARREQRLGDAVTTVEVVSRTDLERSGAADLSAVLIEHTGIELQGGHPAGAGVMLQGIGSERVLILLDGQPLAGRLSGTFDISRIPVAMVERVEVVKGAQSTLYGSEAMGGVINIISRRPATTRGLLGGTLAATAGQQGRRDLTGRLVAASGAWSASSDVARRYVETAPGLSGDDGALANRIDGALKLRWSPDSARSAELSLLALEERQRWRTGNFFGFSDNVQVNGRIGGSWRLGRHRIAPGISLSNWDHLSRRSQLSLPIAGDTGQRQLQRIVMGEMLYSGEYSPRMALDAGVQVRVDEIESGNVPGGLRSHTSLEPFAQLEVTPTSRLSFTPGLRLSQSNIWGTQFTPRLAVRAKVTERLTLRGSLGDGFRAPDFKELFMFFQNTAAGYAVQGNTALRPENSRSAMLGAEWTTAGGYLRSQLFHNEFRNFIETQVISGSNEAPVFEYANRDNGYTRGIEVEAGRNLVESGRIRGELGWSYLETLDRNTQRELLGRPTHSARATLQLALPFRARASLAAVHTGRTPMRRDADSGGVSAYRDAFTRLDLRLARAIPVLDLEFVIGADNVFDHRPAEWAGFTGRHVYTTLSYSFNQSSVR